MIKMTVKNVIKSTIENEKGDKAEILLDLLLDKTGDYDTKLYNLCYNFNGKEKESKKHVGSLWKIRATFMTYTKKALEDLWYLSGVSE